MAADDTTDKTVMPQMVEAAFLAISLTGGIDQREPLWASQPFRRPLSGGPGRPVGSRKKLSEAFIRDVQEDWEQSGKEVLRIMREKFPEIYFQWSKGYRAAGRCLRGGRGTA